MCVELDFQPVEKSEEYVDDWSQPFVIISAVGQQECLHGVGVGLPHIELPVEVRNDEAGQAEQLRQVDKLLLQGVYIFGKFRTVSLSLGRAGVVWPLAFKGRNLSIFLS
jgi:hypothetical protein